MSGNKRTRADKNLSNNSTKVITPDSGEPRGKKPKTTKKKGTLTNGPRSSPLATRSKCKQKDSIAKFGSKQHSSAPKHASKGSENIMAPTPKEIAIKKNLNLSLPRERNGGSTGNLRNDDNSSIPRDCIEPQHNQPGTSTGGDTVGVNKPNNVDSIADDNYRDTIRTSVTQSEDECYQDSSESSSSDEPLSDNESSSGESSDGLVSSSEEEDPPSKHHEPMDPKDATHDERNGL